MATNKLLATDLLVLQRGSNNDIPNTYHFSLGDLNNYMVATGLVCNIESDVPDLVTYGTLWHNTTDTSLQAYDQNGNWVQVAAPYNLLDRFDVHEQFVLSWIDAINQKNEDQDEVISEIDARVSENRSDIDNQDLRLTALEGVAQKAKYKIPTTYLDKDSTIIPGTVQLYKADGSEVAGTDAYSDTANIVLHRLELTQNGDGNNLEPAIDTFAIDDVIRFNGANSVGATFKITNVIKNAPTDGTDYYEYEVTVLGSFADAERNVELDIDFLKSFNPSEYATLGYVDALEDKVEDEFLKKTGTDNQRTMQKRLYLENGVTGKGGSGHDLEIYGKVKIDNSLAVWDSNSNEFFRVGATSVSDATINLGYTLPAEVVVKGHFICLDDNATTVTDNKSFEILKEKTTSYKSFTIDTGEVSGNDTRFSIKGNYVKDGSLTYGQFFKAIYRSGNNQGDVIRYYGDCNTDNDIANVKYVKEAIKEAETTSVEVHDQTSPPPDKPRGTLLLTTSNALYLYI